jgi:hypothetical protein
MPAEKKGNNALWIQLIILVFSGVVYFVSNIIIRTPQSLGISIETANQLMEPLSVVSIFFLVVACIVVMSLACD